jgi:hypothetical protein
MLLFAAGFLTAIAVAAFLGPQRINDVFAWAPFKPAPRHRFDPLAPPGSPIAPPGRDAGAYPMSPSGSGRPSGSLGMLAGADHKCHVKGVLSGTDVDFIINPAATWVFLPLDYIERLHIDRSTLKFDQPLMDEMSGYHDAARYVLPELRIEDYVGHDVVAYFYPLDQPVLGKSFLRDMVIQTNEYGCTLSW